MAQGCSFIFLLCCLLFFIPFPVASSASGLSAVRILYTADTLGQIHPCRTCGETSQGGIARRAALLKNYAAVWPQTLILGGPYEFYSDHKAGLPDVAEHLAPVLHVVYCSMPYTAIYLGPATTADWQRRNLPFPGNAVPVAEQPVTRIFPAGDLTVACIFLPSGTGKNGGPAPEQLLAAQIAAKEAASSADLVIAISPWGILAENALPYSFSGYFHIILGGGDGIAIPGQPTGDPGFPGPLWLRSDRRGRAVNELLIFSLPDFGNPWIEGLHFSSRLNFLDVGLPQDVAVLNQIKKLEQLPFQIE